MQNESEMLKNQIDMSFQKDQFSESQIKNEEFFTFDREKHSSPSKLSPNKARKLRAS